MVTGNFKTMLAVKGTRERVGEIIHEQSNVVVSAKLDGVRCLVHPELGPVTRTLKPIPNKYIRAELSHPAYRGLDGEIVIGSTFQDCQSGVMSHDKEPDFTFYVFDKFDSPDGNTTEEPFYERLLKAHAQVIRSSPSKAVFVPHFNVHNLEKLDDLIREHLRCGYEGTMVRSPMSPYKHGRSTLKQGYLLKFKPLADCEVVMTGYNKLVDKHGVEHRQIGVLKGTVLNGPYEGAHVEVGTGFTKEQREQFYGRAYVLMDNNAIFTIEYQAEGSKNLPRFPSFKGFRDTKDFD